MVIDCVDKGYTSARSGGAGDAMHRQAFATRHSFILCQPVGPRLQGLGTSSAGASDAHASRRTGLLAQALVNAAQPVTITQTGS